MDCVTRVSDSVLSCLAQISDAAKLKEALDINAYYTFSMQPSIHYSLPCLQCIVHKPHSLPKLVKHGYSLQRAEGGSLDCLRRESNLGLTITSLNPQPLDHTLMQRCKKPSKTYTKHFLLRKNLKQRNALHSLTI